MRVTLDILKQSRNRMAQALVLLIVANACLLPTIVESGEPESCSVASSASCCGADNLAGLFDQVPGWTTGLLECSDNETTLGRRLWVGPRWEHREGNDGVFPVEGSLDGVSFGWRTRNTDSLFLSIEGVVMDGGFDPTVGGRTDYEEWQVEALVGYTFTDECRSMFLTPYVGYRYREAENSLGAPLGLEVDQEVRSAPFGVRGDILLTDNFAVGVDARLQWKFDDDQSVTGAFSIKDSSTDTLTYRIDVPVTIRVCNHAEIVLRPYYEWDRFDSDSTARETRIDEYGGQVSFVLRY